MRSWCFDSVATEVDGVTTYDREYGSAEFREVMRKLVGDGVYADPANNMQVTASGGLSVSVLPGYCWIKGALGIVDEAETLTLDAATGSRVDLIVARFDLSLAARDIHLAVVKGTNGSNIAPALTRNDSVYEICLARVHVSATVTNITPANITDTRHDATVCGIVTGVVDQIDATDLFAQYGAVFDEFMAELGDVLTGDVAGNLLTLIDNHKADTNNPHNVTASQVGLGNVLNEKQYCESNPPTTEFETAVLGGWGVHRKVLPYSESHIKGFFVCVFDDTNCATCFCRYGQKIILKGSIPFSVHYVDGQNVATPANGRLLILEHIDNGNVVVNFFGFS